MSKEQAFTCHPDKEKRLKKDGKWNDYKKLLSSQPVRKEEKKAEDRETK